jgi:DNA replication initiation complex subunit (GINS family)
MKGKPPDNIVQLEELFYNSLTKLFAENRDEVFQPAASKPTKQTLVVNKIKVRIMRPLPSIVASDLNEYGPFNGGEVVELPEENARVLITQGIAEEAAR